MSVLGVILARGGSARVPKKNIQPLGGKPLVAWTIEAAQKARRIDRLVTSTDDLEIASVFEAYALPIVMVDKIPSQHNRADHMWQAVHGLEAQIGKMFDVIVDLHADCPFKTAQDIDEAIALLQLAEAESVIAVCDMGAYHPARAKRIDENGYLREFCVPEPPDGISQNLTPKAYVRSAGLYVYRRAALKQGFFGHDKSVALIVPPERGLNVDTELDLLLAQSILERDDRS